MNAFVPHWLRRFIVSAFICFVAIAASLLGIATISSEAVAMGGFDFRNIASVTPPTGPSTGGTTVTITFQDFGDPGPCQASGLSSVTVTFGGVAGTGQDYSNLTNGNHSFTVVTPAHAVGSVDVQTQINCTGFGGGSAQATSVDGFTYTTATTSPTTPTDSTNISSLQVNATTTIATTSVQVITKQIDGAIGDAFSNGDTTNFGPNGGFVSFAEETHKRTPSQVTKEAFAALGYAGNFNKARPRLDRVWSLWADIRGTGWKANDTTGNGNNLKGNQINITVGLGRKLNTDTLVGVVLGYEHFKYDVAALAGSLKGDGETIGGYVARHFGSNLRFSSALAWSNLNYQASAGTASGSFIGSRWLAAVGLTGSHKFNAFVLEPSANLFILWESQRAWTDSLGTMQASRKFSAGRTALGGKVSHPFMTSRGWTISPYAGFYGDWRFQSDSALPTGTPVANIGKGWSGRLTTGLSASARSGATVSLGGEYGGLGANYKIWSGHARGTVPF